MRTSALNGLTPYEHIVKCWTEEPITFNLDPTDLSPGLNIAAGLFDSGLMSPVEERVRFARASDDALTAFLCPVRAADLR